MVTAVSGGGVRVRVWLVVVVVGGGDSGDSGGGWWLVVIVVVVIVVVEIVVIVVVVVGGEAGVAAHQYVLPCTSSPICVRPDVDLATLENTGGQGTSERQRVG